MIWMQVNASSLKELFMQPLSTMPGGDAGRRVLKVLLGHAVRRIEARVLGICTYNVVRDLLYTHLYSANNIMPHDFR